jgi:hypothetical protein
MQQILGVFGYLEMDAGQGGDFGFILLGPLGIRKLSYVKIFKLNG